MFPVMALMKFIPLVVPMEKTRVAGDSIKPGVERSGTPGPEERKNTVREAGDRGIADQGFAQWLPPDSL